MATKKETKKEVQTVGDANANLTELELLKHKKELKVGDALITDNREFTEEGQKPKEVKVDTSEKGAEQSSSQEEKTDWEKSAKYFQSEKDKVLVENEKIKSDLEKYKALGQFVESRKDIQEVIAGAINGEPTKEAAQIDNTPKQPDDFDPWEAFNDPESDSYNYRQELAKHENAKANAAVKQEITQEMAMKEKLSQFDRELTELGLDANKKKDFYKFANTPISQMNTDTLVTMWEAADKKVNTPQNASSPPPEIAVVDRNKEIPAPIGIIQGEQPPPVNQTDDMWDRIVDASKRRRVI